jgi:hypothetical protein
MYDIKKMKECRFWRIRIKKDKAIHVQMYFSIKIQCFFFVTICFLKCQIHVTSLISKAYTICLILFKSGTQHENLSHSFIYFH